MATPSKKKKPITPPKLQRVNVQGNVLVPEAVAEEKVAQNTEDTEDTQQVSHNNPWWGDSA